MSAIINFFNSNFFIGIVTLAVGTVAFIVYKKQKHDAKRDAANVILLEIESAERQIPIIRSQPQDELAENIFLMKNASWDKYRHLFVRDFDRNEWDKITDFYSKCLEYDESVNYKRSYFGGNADKAMFHIQATWAKYAQEYVEETEGIEESDELVALKQKNADKKRKFLTSYGILDDGDDSPGPYFYSPRKPGIESRQVLETIETSLSLTTIGIKLKKMSSGIGLIRRAFSGLKKKKSI